MKLAILVLAVSACAATYHADAQRLRGAQTSGFEGAVPQSYAAREPRVGQWVLTRATTSKGVLYGLSGIVSAAPCGLWLYIWAGDEKHRALIRTCLHFGTRGELRTVRGSETSTKIDNHEWVVVAQVCSAGVCPPPIALLDYETLDGVIEDVTVPAGSFHGAKRVSESSSRSVWYHPDVPIGALKERNGSTEIVVIGFGQTGAKELFDALSK